MSMSLDQSLDHYCNGFIVKVWITVRMKLKRSKVISFVVKNMNLRCEQKMGLVDIDPEIQS